LIPDNSEFREMVNDSQVPVHLTHPAQHDRMVELVERMMMADGLRLTAYGPDEDEIGVVEGAANG